MSDRIDSFAGRAVDSANQGMKALLTINGGAAITSVGFISSIAGKEAAGSESPYLAAATKALLFFGWGTLISAMLFVVAYLVNRRDFFFERGDIKSISFLDRTLGVLVVIFITGSLACFALGFTQIASIR